MDMAHAQLEVTVQEAQVALTLTVDNRSGKTVYVPRELAEDDELFGPYFEISDVDGDVVAYIGPKVKRGPLAREDLLALQPQQQLRHTIDITRAYAFLPGRHTYRISYTSMPFAMTSMAPLNAAPATFTYTRP